MNDYTDAMTIKLDYELPAYPKMEDGFRRAPKRESKLSEADKALAIKNALRYIHPDHHWKNTDVFTATASARKASSTANRSTNTKVPASKARRSRS